jgi:cytochrome P450
MVAIFSVSPDCWRKLQVRAQPGHCYKSQHRGKEFAMAHPQNVADVNLFDPATQENWYPTYDLLRAEAPVYKVPGLNLYVLTRYEDIHMVVRRSDLYSNQGDKYGGEPLLLHPEARAIFEREGWVREFPLSTDPPVHKLYRGLVDPFFQGKGLNRVRAFATDTVHDLIDGFYATGEAEFVQAFAVPLPVTVITWLIGFPLEDMPKLKDWSYWWALPFARGLSLEQELTVARKGVEFQHYIKHFIEARRADPRDDIISSLVHVRFPDPLKGERGLTDQEIICIVDHLYIGGNETTTFSLTSGLWLMLREPEIYQRLLTDRSAETMRTFIEEVLRLESPTQGLYRTAIVDSDISGVHIPKGATLHLRFAAANRDPAEFACPHALNLDRDNAARHMAFSQAEHHCPGAPLSRLEMAIVFPILLERLQQLRFSEGRNDFTHMPGFVLRALKELNVRFQGRAR